MRIIRVWVVTVYEWCRDCNIRAVAEPGALLCARCRAQVDLELEKLLKEG